MCHRLSRDMTKANCLLWNPVTHCSKLRPSAGKLMSGCTLKPGPISFNTPRKVPTIAGQTEFEKSFLSKVLRKNPFSLFYLVAWRLWTWEYNYDPIWMKFHGILLPCAGFRRHWLGWSFAECQHDLLGIPLWRLQTSRLLELTLCAYTLFAVLPHGSLALAASHPPPASAPPTCICTPKVQSAQWRVTTQSVFCPSAVNWNASCGTTECEETEQLADQNNRKLQRGIHSDRSLT